MSKAIGALFLAAGLALAAGPSTAQTPQLETGDSFAVRLAGESPPSDRLDRYVALNTRSRTIVIEPDTEAARETFEALTRRVCGTVRPAYVEQLRLANNMAALSFSDAVGARTLVLPACLYFRPIDKRDTALWRGLPPATVYEGLTGQTRFTNAELSRYFRMTGNTVINRSEPNTLHAPSNLTRSLAVEPVRGDAASYLRGFRAAGGNEEAIVDPYSQEGDIVLALGAEDDRCTPDQPNAPFDPRAVERAFAYTLGRTGRRADSVDVLVVDNGFFGANVNLGSGQEFAGSPFPREFFSLRESGLEHFVQDDPPIYAINYSNNVSPGEISGHGTHVTGLLIGGPQMRESNVLRRGSDSWLRIRFVNVARGGERLIRGSYHVIDDYLPLSGRAIANMSLMYSGKQDAGVFGNFVSMFDQHNGVLFVVAAGNAARGQNPVDPRDHELYPAGLGGLGGRSNLITVAALEANARIAPFSNRGQSVDIAAPGCRLQSWTRNSIEMSSQSGTSSATPIVSFAALLLQASDAERFRPASIRGRLIVSGDMLHKDDRLATAFRTRLNIERALYWTDDIVRISAGCAGQPCPAAQEMQLGAVSRLQGASCVGEHDPLVLANLWALKRDNERVLWAYRGRSGGALTPPCEVRLLEDAAITVRFNTAITPAGERPARNMDSVPLSELEELIMRAR